VSLVELAQFPFYFEAEIARSRLESEGLHAVVFDHFANQYLAWGRTIGVRLMVLDEDYDAARAILDSVGIS
jgi:hypothetical protein